jgi:predicted transcriptional regulator
VAFESSSAAPLDQDIKLEDVFRALEFANNGGDEEEKLFMIEKLVVLSSKALKAIFPDLGKPIKAEDRKAIHDHAKMKRDKILARIVEAGTNPDKSFHFGDIFYMMFGTLEGSMGAIPSSKLNYQCGKNATLARQYTEEMVSDFSMKERNDGVTQLYKIMQLTDDLTINCVGALTSSSSATSDLS